MVMRSLEGKQGRLLGRGFNWHRECQPMFPQGLGTEQTPSLTEELVGAGTENRSPYICQGCWASPDHPVACWGALSSLLEGQGCEQEQSCAPWTARQTGHSRWPWPGFPKAEPPSLHLSNKALKAAMWKAQGGIEKVWGKAGYASKRSLIRVSGAPGFLLCQVPSAAVSVTPNRVSQALSSWLLWPGSWTPSCQTQVTQEDLWLSRLGTGDSTGRCRDRHPRGRGGFWQTFHPLIVGFWYLSNLRCGRHRVYTRPQESGGHWLSWLSCSRDLPYLHRPWREQAYWRLLLALLQLLLAAFSPSWRNFIMMACYTCLCF